MGEKLKFGDFTGLAQAYSEARPKYAPQVLELLVSIGNLDSSSHIVDVGAGTGIWTRMIYERLLCPTTAIEPNEDMFKAGVLDSYKFPITWINNSAEKFKDFEMKADLITMASSFHWVDYEVAINKFKRNLSDNGIFCALWNTRAFELNPKLLEIEEYLRPKLVKPRVSSGRSQFTDSLLVKLEASFGQENVIYTEAHHTEVMTKARYIRAWESVNDVQVQLGKQGFEEFIQYIENKFGENELIESQYLTRAWIAAKKD